MRQLRYLALLAVLALPAAYSQAQVSIGVRIGPDYGYYNAPPVCAYGYYPDYPFGCAPYGYWGPEWFVDGVFIGAGPWYHFYYTHPEFYRRGYYWGRGYGYRRGFEHFRGDDRWFRDRDRFRGGHGFDRDDRGFRDGGREFHGGDRGFRDNGRGWNRGGGREFHDGGGERFAHGSGGNHGGGRGDHGEGGHGGRR
jgi:hypothetical protein